MTDERTLLTEIAYGADASLTPRDRLKAIELLRGLPDDTPRDPDFRGELRHLTGEELDGWLDELCGEEIVAAALSRAGRWPRMERAIAEAVDARARVLAPELALELVPDDDA